MDLRDKYRGLCAFGHLKNGRLGNAYQFTFLQGGLHVTLLTKPKPKQKNTEKTK
jgi:hypothetical protein